jgi:hypothetical protein
MKRIALLTAVALAVTIASTDAYALSNRTFVSGNGNDSNPCSIAAPCRSFAGAIAQTSPGGEIAVLDTAGYGAVTITKAVSIVNEEGVEAGITVTSGDGITRTLRSQHTPASPDRPRLRRGDGANGASTVNGADHPAFTTDVETEFDDNGHLPIGPKDRHPGDVAPSTVSIRNPQKAPHKRDLPSRRDNPSPAIQPISEARTRPPVPYLIERYSGDRPPRQLVHEVMPTNDMSHALAMSRLSTRRGVF